MNKENAVGVNKLRLLKHSSIYWLGAMLSKVVGFFLIPLYTHYLNPEEYGKLELVSLTADVFALFIGMQLNIAVFKYYNEAKDEENKKITISTAIVFITLVALTAFGSLILISGNISELILKSNTYSNLFVLAFIGYFFAIILEVPMGYIRIQEKSTQYITINFIQLLAQVSLNVLFIVKFGLGILGIFLAPVIVFGISSFLLIGFTLRNVGLQINKDLIIKYIKYSVPLIPGALSMFVINFSDRFILSKYVSIYDLGIYSLGYKFGILISQLIIQPFNLIWQPKMFEYYGMENRSEILSDVLSWIGLILVFAVLGITLLIDPVLSVMTTKEFQAAASLVPIVAVGYVFSGLSIVASTAMYAEGKTKTIGAINSFAAVFCVAVNFILIPIIGLYGAAYSTLLTYALIFALSVVASNKLNYIAWQWANLIKVFFVAGILVSVYEYTLPENLFFQVGYSGVLIILFLPLLYMTGFFKASDVDMVKKVILSKIKTADQ